MCSREERNDEKSPWGIFCIKKRGNIHMKNQEKLQGREERSQGEAENPTRRGKIGKNAKK